jgi:transcriptional regulator with XRE-family HTH domain
VQGSEAFVAMAKAVSLEPRDSLRKSKLEILGAFLRSRRERRLPLDAGIKVSARRRTPGLRREEVAELAGISPSWYTRVELGTADVPSRATIYAIVRALGLDQADAGYIFELAGLALPSSARLPDVALSPSFDHFVLNLSGLATIVFDWYATPYGWNAVADGMFHWSRRDDPFERNLIVSGLTDPHYRNLCGSDAEYEKVAAGVIGMFRRKYTASEPTLLARRIFEFGMTDALFRSIWNASNVAETFTAPGPVVRYVPEFGALRFDVTDLVPVGRQDTFLRVMVPSDPQTRAALPSLEVQGIPRRFHAD